MNITLRRTEYRCDGVFGSFLDESGDEVAATLEHAYNDDTNGWVPKIPSGTYTCQRRLSPRFGYYLFQVMDVPGHDNCEIHCGNFNRDSEGCILVGVREVGSMITASREAFDKFMKLQTGIDQFQLLILAKNVNNKPLITP